MTSAMNYRKFEFKIYKKWKKNNFKKIYNFNKKKTFVSKI